jgi:hypothetical protein
LVQERSHLKILPMLPLDELQILLMHFLKAL